MFRRCKYLPSQRSELCFDAWHNLVHCAVHLSRCEVLIPIGGFARADGDSGYRVADLTVRPDCTSRPEPLGRILYWMHRNAGIDQKAWGVIHTSPFVKRADDEDTHAPGAGSSDRDTVATVRDGHSVHATTADGADGRGPRARVRADKMIVLQTEGIQRNTVKRVSVLCIGTAERLITLLAAHQVDISKLTTLDCSENDRRGRVSRKADMTNLALLLQLLGNF